jgi:hypothetical protein
MGLPPRRILIAAGLYAILASSTLVFARQDLTKAEADSMEQKLSQILGNAAQPAVRAPGVAVPRRTSFTEREVNAYLRFNGKEQVPVGIINPVITIADAGQIDGRAIVDLDAVRTSKDRGLLDPGRYLLTGRVEVHIVGTLRAERGQGSFDLASATLGGVPLPKSLLQELVSYYSKTPDTPDGVSLDKPFELPVSIQAVETRRGGATVVQ